MSLSGDDVYPPVREPGPMRRDWLGHWAQIGVVALMLFLAILAGQHYVDTKFADQANAFEHKLGAQAADIQVLQSQQTSLQHEVEREEARQQAFEEAVGQKLDTVVTQAQAISTDLALLRKELRR